MEGVSANAYNGLKAYWKRREYERINVGSSGGRRRRTRNRVHLGTAVSGSGGSGGRRFWRIRIGPKLKVKLRFSPKKFFLGLRDAYVNMMLRFANSRTIGTGNGFTGDSAGGGFGRGPLKEYDERMIIQIYKSLAMAQAQSQGQLVPRDASAAAAAAARVGTVVSCRQ